MEEKSKISELRKEVLTAAREAYRLKLMAGTSGNLSAWDAASGCLVITPSGYAYDLMEEEDLVVMDLDGQVREGFRKPSSEWRMHAAIYRSLPRIGAVVHTHSPYASAFAVLHREIPEVLIEMTLFLGGSIEVAPYARQGTAEVGESAVPILARKNACLLANHGVVTVGETVQKALLNSIYAEDSARTTQLAMAMGEPVLIPGDGH